MVHGNSMMHRVAVSVMVVLSLVLTIPFRGCHYQELPEKGLFSVRGTTIVPPRIVTRRFDDTARFIGGVELDAGSSTAILAGDREYRRYRELVERSWNGFFVANRDSARSWGRRMLRGAAGTTVFYPFSGPDILHPFTFFPETRDIIMFGLEPVGGIPDPGRDGAKAVAKLGGLTRALNFVLRHAFFVTLDMVKEIGGSSYSGITGVMLFFLARDGYTVHDIRPVWITGGGKLASAPPGKGTTVVPGIELVFSERGARELIRARYFQLDISDRSRQFSLFRDLILSYPPVTTIIKSASYLMYDLNAFSRIRDLILSRSTVVLQDDSGMPLRAFPGDVWDIDFHGYYHEPLPVFRQHAQPELARQLGQKSTGALPFRYGYGYGFDDMTYHLIFARRKQGPPERR